MISTLVSGCDKALKSRPRVSPGGTQAMTRGTLPALTALVLGAKSGQVTRVTQMSVPRATALYCPEELLPGGGCWWSNRVGVSGPCWIECPCAGGRLAGHLSAHTDDSLCVRPDLWLLAGREQSGGCAC